MDVRLSIWVGVSAWLSLTGAMATEQVENSLAAAAEITQVASEPSSVNTLLQAENVALDKPINEQDIVESAIETLSDRDGQPRPEIQEEQDAAITRQDGGDRSSTATGAGQDEMNDVAGHVEKVDATAVQTPDGSLLADPQSVNSEDSTPRTEPADDKVPLEPKPFVLLGTEVPPATSTRLAWAPSQSFEGIYSATPVLVVNGAKPGPTLCLTAALHGDELNGIETVRRILYNLDANRLKGTVVGVPIVNLQGFRRGSRYLSDRRDLNRFFPGDPQGSSAARIAHSFFHEIIHHCSAVVDLHTGSFYRTNLPQLRADLTHPKVVKMTEGFGSTVVLHSKGSVGTLRRAAVAIGIPTVTLEAGMPMVLDEAAVSHSVKGIQTLLHQLGMVSKFSLWGDPEPVYYNSVWQRAPEGGIIFSKVELGEQVRSGDLLGTVTNPITNVRTEIRSSYNGRILGMALNQVVQPGFAAYHIGIQAPDEQISEPEEVTAEAETGQSLPASAQTDAAPSGEPVNGDMETE